MSSIETNKNRVILLSRKRVPSETDDNMDWKHSIYNIFNNDKNLGIGSEKIFEDTSNDPTDNRVRPWESSIVRNDINLLMTTQPKFSTSNTFDAIEGDIDSIKQGVGDAYSAITDLLPFPFGSILKAFGSLVSFGAKAGEKAYEVAQSVSANKAGNTTSMAFSPWYDNLPAWRSADRSISFAYSFNFALGQYGLWSAKEEVYKPIMNLLSLASPRYLTAFGISGPFPNANQLLLNLSGNTLGAVLNSDAPSTESNKSGTSNYLTGGGGYQATSAYGPTSNNYDVNEEQMSTATSMMETIFKNTLNDFTYTMKFGNFLTLNHVLIKNCDCEFSNEVDQFGYPISGSITVQFSTLLPYTLGINGTGVIPVRFRPI